MFVFDVNLWMQMVLRNISNQDHSMIKSIGIYQHTVIMITSPYGNMIKNMMFTFDGNLFMKIVADGIQYHTNENYGKLLMVSR